MSPNVARLVLSALTAPLVFVVVWMTGCDEDLRATPGCTPNQTQECACPGQQLGIQTCQADNTWSDCVCGTADAGPTDMTGDDADAGESIEIELSEEFEPDPREIELTVGGPIDFSEEGHVDDESGEHCTGFVPEDPHVDITIVDPAPAGIRLQVESEIDTTLIVHLEDPDIYRCNDDHGEDYEPLIDLNELEAGDIGVWVGSLEGEAPATLKITEL